MKFFAVCILFAVSMYLIGMSFVLGLCGYLIIKGVTYFGFYIIMLSLFLLGVVFFKLLFNFVLDKKNKGSMLFLNIFLSIILLGSGCGLAFFEVSDTEFINHAPKDLETEVLTEELTMTKDTIFLGNISNYIVDDTLDIVKVEYIYYPVGQKMMTNIRKKEEKVYLDWNLEKIHIKSDLFEHIIKDLKEKKVYNYHLEPTITITTNQKNIDQIKKNRQKYYRNETTYSSCEFIRTFQIEKIIDTRETKKEVQVLISQYLVEEQALVSIKREFAENLIEKENYEFTFKTFQNYIDTDIKNLFEENEVIKIEKTEKKGLEQKQEESCPLF